MKFALLLGRILFASIFIMSAPGHFTKPMIQMAAAHGVAAPDIVVPLAGVIALMGGLSVLTGCKAHLGAWMLVVFLVPVTLAMHNFWAISDPGEAKMQQIMFMKNLTMIGGALMIAYFGAGPVSVDARRAATPNRTPAPEPGKTVVAHP